MARDLSVDVRRFIVSALNADGSATKAITEGRAYGPSVPKDAAWPFVRVDLPIVVPDYDGCSDASRYVFRVNGFTASDDEAQGSELNAAIASDLDGLSGDLGVDPEAHVKDAGWTGSQLLSDTDRADGWHGIVSMSILVAG